MIEEAYLVFSCLFGMLFVIFAAFEWTEDHPLSNSHNARILRQGPLMSNGVPEFMDVSISLPNTQYTAKGKAKPHVIEGGVWLDRSDRKVTYR